jgi:hypothetical protein
METVDGVEMPRGLDEDSQMKWRKLDQETRWTIFLFHSHKFLHSVIKKSFGDIDEDSDDYLLAREKIMNNVKNYKNKTLKAIEVSLDYNFCSIANHIYRLM